MLTESCFKVRSYKALRLAKVLKLRIMDHFNNKTDANANCSLSLSLSLSLTDRERETADIYSPLF